MNVKRSVLFVLLVMGCGIGGVLLLRPAPHGFDAPGTRPPGVVETNRASARTAGVPAVPRDDEAAYKAAIEEVNTWKVGGPTADGNFIFADWGAGLPRQGRIYLLSDYGFMLINEGSYDHPKAVYLLGLLQQKRVEVFRTFAAFKQGLRAIPRGATVYLHTVCTAGTAPGIGEKTWSDVERAFRKAHLKFDQNDHVMYCVCGEGADPDPDVPRELKANYVRLYGLSSFAQHVLGHGDGPGEKE